MIKPLKGNDCETCPKRFKCLTGKQQKMCPVVLGEELDIYADIDKPFIADNYGASLVLYIKERNFKLRITPFQLLLMLKNYNFTTHERQYEGTRGHFLEIKEKK